MAQSILIFDFGTKEDTAQQARHKLERWKQAFRLGNKILLKFERQESPAEEAKGQATPAVSEGKGKKKTAAASAKEGNNEDKEAARIRLLVRLAFSDHEKMSYQQWLSRIRGEESFKKAKAESVNSGDSSFATVSELFDSLD